MAAEQLSRRGNTTKEGEIQVEKEKVPQLTSHFEAIAVQGKAATPEKTEERQRSSLVAGEKRRRVPALPKGHFREERRDRIAEGKVGAGESVKEYTARKKEEAERESMYKQAEKESMYEKTKETFEGAKEEVKERGGDDGGILGAIGETIYEIVQTTKEMVIGHGD